MSLTWGEGRKVAKNRDKWQEMVAAYVSPGTDNEE